ncbi:hypothetical protein GCM10027189_39030 [Rufibacter soli]
MTVHFHYSGGEQYVPEEEQERRRKDGEEPTACGYTRKHTSANTMEVTCFYCNNWLKKQSKN